MPSAGWSDRVSLLGERWQIAPRMRDGPVTGLERAWDALEDRCPLWDLAVIYGALLAILAAYAASIVGGVR